MKKYLEFIKESISEQDLKEVSKIVGVDGHDVYIGRNSHCNDYLTMNSEPNWIWFHAKGVPGSHVVLNDSNINNMDLIEKVAKIAAFNSKLGKSGEKRIKVVYCYVHYVTKEEGTNPGTVKVDYDNAKEITVEL